MTSQKPKIIKTYDENGKLHSYDDAPAYYNPSTGRKDG